MNKAMPLGKLVLKVFLRKKVLYNVARGRTLLHDLIKINLLVINQ